MKNNIRLSKSFLGTEEIKAITNVIKKDGYLGMGNEVYLFEKEIANYLGVPKEHVVCVNSGTSKMLLAAFSLNNCFTHTYVPCRRVRCVLEGVTS